MIARFLLLLFGVFTGASAVIMIKACTVHPVLLASYRQLVAAAVLAPLFFRDLRRCRGQHTLAHVGRTVLPGLMLGGHFITWIIGARLTLAGNANLIVNFVPVVMPFLLYLLVRERPNLGELGGTLLAVAGVAVLVGGDYHLSGEEFLGDVICFVSMLLFAGYLALGRRNRDFPTIWLYLVPLYFFGGVFCFIVSLFYVSPLAVDSLHDLAMVIGLGVVPTVIGHSMLNIAMKWFRGQVVGIAGLTQFIFAAILAWLLLGEVPTWHFYVAAALVGAGSLVALRATPPQDVIVARK